jgi:hypothetical protein
VTSSRLPASSPLAKFYQPEAIALRRVSNDTVDQVASLSLISSSSGGARGYKASDIPSEVSVGS